MSRLYDTVEPSVISEEMLASAVEEQGLKEEMGKISKFEGIDFTEVTALRLDYKNILKIDNLWCFKNLVKLQLDNNIIETIEGLNVLVNLVWLDLSFNNIEVIEGLDHLTKLEDLTLFNNRIQRLENMDSLTELQVFSIGNNELKELANIVYLRRFKKLKTIGLVGNPICQLEEYRSFVIAHLTTLDYLDYRLIDPAAKSTAYDQYETEVQEIQLDERQAQAKADELAAKEQELILHKSAYVENLNSSHLFDSMYADDADGRKLNQLPGLDEMVQLYKDRFTAVCLQMFNYGLEKHAEREAEMNLFIEAIEEAKRENKRLASARIDEFMAFKQKVWHDLAQTTEHTATDVIVSDYHQSINELWDALMLLEMQLVEQLEEAIKDFEQSMNELVSTFIETIQGYTTQCRELENFHHEHLLEASVNALEKAMKNELDEELSDDLLELLVDKDTVSNAVTTSHDNHLLKIDNREDEITTHIRQWLTALVDETHEQEDIIRNRARVTEINNLIDHLRDEIDTLDLYST